MTGINFNPQPINNRKTPLSKEGTNEQPPQTTNIDDFMNTKEGQAFLAVFKKNQANVPQPVNNGTVIKENNQQPPKGPYLG